MRFLNEIKLYAIKARQQFTWADLKWSYLIIGGLFLLCIPISFMMKDGWTIWPMLPVLAMLIVINESAERNGQGVPPFQVYAFFGMVIGVWIVGVIVLSKVNVFVQLLAMGVLAYYSLKAHLLQRERMRIIEMRRNEGCCIHCGEPSDPEAMICEECGLEVDPERTSQQRTASIALYGKKSDRAREVLTPQSLGNIAAAKEKALLANSPRRRGKPPRR
jgi:hypothetical protein